MKKEVYKILPNGNPSGLSLNQFTIWRDNLSLWNGKKGKETYSISLIREKFYQYFPEYENKSEFNLLQYMRENYKKNVHICQIIKEIIEGLSYLLLSLHEGCKICKELNPNLFENDWDFWKNCQKIVLDGKLLEGDLGDEIIKSLSDILKNEFQIHRLSEFTNIQTPSLLGCADHEETKQYVFDFGNTAIKRGIAQNGEINELETIYHEDFWNLPNTIETAHKIDDFIVNTIVNILPQTEKEYQIRLCLANNIIDNHIADRGSYRSLRLLGDDYLQHLTQKLKHNLQKSVHLKIYNDSEAVGRIFGQDTPHMAIITLGTYLGIAYPPKKL